MSDMAVPIFMAWVGGSLGTLLVRSLAWKLNLVNEPNDIVPQHTQPVAYLGGIGVLLGLLAGSIYLPTEYLPSKGIIISTIAFTLIGMLDDLQPLSPPQKIILQIVAAALSVYLGVIAHITGITFIDLAFSIFWIVSILNAFNLTDVCDGLVASLTLGMLLAFVLFTNDTYFLAAIAASAIFGFLPFNLPKASIFLGDAGSHLTGFLVVSLSMSMPNQGPWCQTTLLVFTALVPLFEIIFVTIVRFRKGLPWWKGSPDHFSLRLQNMGWSRWTINILGAIISFGFSSIGILICCWPIYISVLIFICVILLVYFFSNYLLSSK